MCLNDRIVVTEVYCVMVSDISGYAPDELLVVCATEEVANAYIDGMTTYAKHDAYIKVMPVLSEAPDAPQ